jgi:hypothetical protein
VSDVFGKMLVNFEDFQKGFDIQKATLEWLVNNGKQVLCYAYHYLTKNNKILTEEFLLRKGILQSHKFVTSFWANDDNADRMFAKASQFVQSH